MLKNYSQFTLGGYNFYKLVTHDYILYFGRYSEEKGIKTLLEVCRKLLDIKFVFAGKGPLEDEINAMDNIENVGFKKGEALNTLIKNALFSVYPSEWYENCPFSVIESMMLGTPVLGADIGGIPELIDDKVNGELFKSGDAEELSECIKNLWMNRDRVKTYTENCKSVDFDTVALYVKKLVMLYLIEEK